MISQVYTPKPQFTWHKITSQFRASHDKKFTTILLTPSVKFCIAEIQDTQVQTRLFVDIEKSLQFQSSIGWNWHKSSNLPILSLKITIVNPKTGEMLIPSEKLQAKIYAVKIGEDSFEKKGNFYLEDVGLKGQTKIQLNDGCGYFHSLRFTSTSYNNEGRKFHLLIVIQAAQSKNESNENILCSLLSSPIFVDSRKSARNYQVNFKLKKVKKYLSFVNLFELSEITKSLCQNDMKQETQKKLKIFNSEDGLYTYLTAPNIRNKIKHPLFLAHHFSNALKIYCNTKSKNFMKKEITLNRVINILQKKLINELGMLRKNRKRINIDETQFVITISLSSTIQKAKIFESLQYLECKSIHILEADTFNNSNFIEIFTLGNFQETYRKQYAALKAKSERQISVRQQKLSKEEQQKDAFEKPERNKAQLEENPHSNSQNHKFCFSKSNEGEDDNIQDQQEKRMKNLEFNDIVLGQKRVKINQEQNFSAQSRLLEYPVQVYHSGTVFPQSFMPYNLNRINENYPMDSTVMVKKEESYEIKNLSRNEIVLKIKQMCMEVYHRNKFTIMYHLQTLKKSNVKWQVKDVQNFVIQYSESLMGALSFREQLLHHMYLENQIMKAKVGIMKQMALGDLQNLKRNIMSMNRFLPEKFIVKKLKENQLWSEDHENLLSKPKFAGFKEIQYFKKDEKDEGRIPRIDENKSQEIEEQKSQESRTPKEYSFSYSCNFVSNVFEFEQSPLIEE